MKSDYLASSLPSVAVVIPCWNAEKWIARAIQSVLDQDYSNLELIVVDDGSVDLSLDVIRSFGDRLHWQTGANRGACAARNHGLQLAKSEYVLFLDADDYLEGCLIGGLARVARANNADLAVGQSVIEETNGAHSLRVSYPVGSTSLDIARSFLQGTCVQTGALLWRREYLMRLNGWNENVVQEQEIEVVLRSILSGAKTAISDTGWAVWCNHDAEHRISKQRGRAVLTSQVEYYGLLAARAVGAFAELQPIFARRLYGFSLGAFASGFEDLGYAALHRARELGLEGYPGNVLRALVCPIVGIATAERLAQLVRNARNALNEHQSKRSMPH